MSDTPAPQTTSLAEIVDWSKLTRDQIDTVFVVLRQTHTAVMSHVRIGEGIDNTVPFAIATDINNTMRRADDEIARRDEPFTKGTP